MWYRMNGGLTHQPDIEAETDLAFVWRSNRREPLRRDLMRWIGNRKKCGICSFEGQVTRHEMLDIFVFFFAVRMASPVVHQNRAHASG